MNELADRLKSLKDRATKHITNDEYHTAQALHLEMAAIIWQQCEAITKALRFAGYMERLETCCENIRLHKNGGAWYLDADRSDGPNIHSVENNQSILDAVSEAARRAVESMEKGESDGK